MIKKLGIGIFILFGIAPLVYLAWPAPNFPDTLWDFQSSNEPADKETPLRRGYFTNLTREQLMDHYSEQFRWGIRLNYPPEEAQTLIRDQTKVTFLEEIVHPMRESLFVAGNEIQSDKGFYEVAGVKFKQKVFVKYADSNIFIRLFVGFLTLIVIWAIGNEFVITTKEIKKWISR